MPYRVSAKPPLSAYGHNMWMRSVRYLQKVRAKYDWIFHDRWVSCRYCKKTRMTKNLFEKGDLNRFSYCKKEPCLSLGIHQKMPKRG